MSATSNTNNPTQFDIQPDPNTPFTLISTDALRAKEREIWTTYPEDMTRRWRMEDDMVVGHHKSLLEAQKRELDQVKPQQHNLHHKEGNLFYPSTVDSIRSSLGE